MNENDTLFLQYKLSEADFYDNDVFVKFINEFKVSFNLTIKDLARYLDYNASDIDHWLIGVNLPPLTEREYIKQILKDITYDHLDFLKEELDFFKEEL